MQPNYKRTSKRKRIQEMEKEMEELRRSVSLQQGRNKSPAVDVELEQRRIASGSLLHLSSDNTVTQYPVPSGNNQNSQLPSPVFNADIHQQEESFHSVTTSPASTVHRGESPAFKADDFECQPKSLDDFTLESADIKKLYGQFVKHYHPFLPVVDVSKGPEQIYSLSPPLFWTIMTVAARRYQNGSLVSPLNNILKSCLSELAVLPVTRFAGSGESPSFNVSTAYGVQAFLLSTFWPLPSSSLTCDISYNAAGTAMINATRGGLHCPEYAREFGRIKVDNPVFPRISEQIRTWVSCNIATQTVAGVFGLPSFTIFDTVVLSACNPASEIDIPLTIKYHLQIQYLEHEIEKSLNSNLKDALGLASLAERLSLIQILSNKLEQLEMMEEKMPDVCKIALKIARIHLMTYYFLDNDDFSNLNMQKGLVQAYNSALGLLELVDEICKTKDRSFARYLPTSYVLSLWQASAIVNRVCHSQFGQYVDVKAGKNLYRLTIHHVKQGSLLKHDVCYRAAEIMDQTWQVFDALVERNGQPYTSHVKIRSRRAASVFFDTLWTVREEVGIRSQAHPVLNQQTGSDDDDLSTSTSEMGSRTSPQPISGTAMDRLNAEAIIGPSTTAGTTGAGTGAAAGRLFSGTLSNGKGQARPFSGALVEEMTGQPQIMGNLNNLKFNWQDAESVFREVDTMMIDMGFQPNGLIM